jgi:ribosomal protein L31E
MSGKSKEAVFSINLSRVKNAPFPDRREVAIRKIREKASKAFKGKRIVIGSDLNEYVHSNLGRVLKGRLRVLAIVEEDEVLLRLPGSEQR